MGAFILGTLVLVATVCVTALIVMGDEMSDNPSVDMNPWPLLIGGVALTVLIYASHWAAPHIGW